MTTIAWDGTMLAADRMMTDGSFKATKTKIRATNIGLLGAAGDARYTSAAMDWLAKEDFGLPYPNSGEDDDVVNMIHVHLDGKIDVYFNCSVPVRVESVFYALGSGRDFALAAMHLGESALKAIEVASALDVNTGNGFNVFRLEDCK